MTAEAVAGTPPPAATSVPAATMPAGRSWNRVIRVGLVGGAIALYLCLVGIVPVFNPRPLIAGIISLGQTALVLAAMGAAYMATRRAPVGTVQAIAAGVIAGALTGAFPAALVLIGSVVDVRGFAPNASPALYSLLTFNNGVAGAWIPVVMLAVVGGAAGALAVLRDDLRRPIAWGLLSLLVVGLFSGLVRTPLLANPLTSGLGRFLFAQEGLTLAGAVITVVVVVGAQQLNRVVQFRRRIAELPEARRKTLFPPALILGILFILWLPQGVGPFFAQVVAVVTLYVLMGFGLNITLGLAGLLDLGFVAFFAVGAYTVGLLTSTAEYGIAHWPFWAAVPFAVIFAMAFGAILGLPILRIRGDYLAIATLGFGEIIRLLAGSDLLKPFLGGPRGIVNIPKPLDVPPNSFLSGPLQIYYIALVAAVIVAFVALRLRDSRIGRAWIAVREDEDVAEALGINLVQTKLLAYVLGAAFAGLGGAIFSALLGSIFASSIQLFISINVVALLIVGGMGSIPGVVVGAIFLIGIPELFREFSEYRFLFYGAALIAMMIYRPEGLLPSRIAKRELHVPEGADAADPSAVPIGETPARAL
jgi:branched-chain amino acid transport system permease protein